MHPCNFNISPCAFLAKGVNLDMQERVWKSGLEGHPVSHCEGHCYLGDQAMTFNRLISYVFEPWDPCDFSC